MHVHALDLSKISIDEFEATLLAVELIPGPRVLKDHIDEMVRRLHERAVDDLEAPRRLLRGKDG